MYGTDAVAGVINYRTVRNFTGTELQARYGQTSYDDGQEWRGTLTHGLKFAGGKGRAMVTADYYHRNAILARNRPFSAEADNSYRAPAPWNIPNTATSQTAAGDFNSRSATTEFGNYVASFVILGDNAVQPDGNVENSIDGDLQTHTTMGNTVGSRERLRVTLGFLSSSGPPPG